MLKRLTDIAEADWIVHGRVPQVRRPGFNPVRVENMLPPKFPGYSKLFHPIRTDRRVDDRTMSWNEAKGELCAGRPILPEHVGERVLWRDLAEQLNLLFHAEINETSFRLTFPNPWPRYLLGPDEGNLDRETRDALISQLSKYSGEQSIFYYYEGLSLSGDDFPNPRLYKGDLQDVHATLDMPGVMTSPEYWWPEDRSWCVNTDWDLCFTVVAGPSDVLLDLSNLAELESLPITPWSRVDYQADQVNLTFEGKAGRR